MVVLITVLLLLFVVVGLQLPVVCRLYLPETRLSVTPLQIAMEGAVIDDDWHDVH